MILNIIFVIFFNFFKISNAKILTILMPNVTTNIEDAYMATSYKLENDHRFITGIQPLTNAHIAHHMFAFGCQLPSSSASSWEGSDVCLGKKILLYAWGLNAKALELPEVAAFKVGPSTDVKYIVINIHYLNKATNDNSGIAITFSDTGRLYDAGIMILLPSYFQIPPMTKEYSTTMSCQYEGNTLSMFAFRVHAHVHGDVNTAYRIRNNNWTEIAKGNPQLPQAFYPTDSIYEIKNGDILVGMCTYHNNESRTIYPGSTHTDEMCNIYIMYYTKNAENVMDTCVGNKYPALEQIIPPDAKIKPIILDDQTQYIVHPIHDHHLVVNDSIKSDISTTTISSNIKSSIFINFDNFALTRKILGALAFLATIIIMLAIAISIKSKRNNSKRNIIRFKQINDGLKNKGKLSWFKNLTNPSNNINFVKLNQDSDSEETIRTKKRPFTDNQHLVSDSDSEDVVMSLNHKFP